MQNFINDFNIFFNSIFGSLISFFNWYKGTILGEITIFIVIIFIFIAIINTIIAMKD